MLEEIRMTLSRYKYIFIIVFVCFITYYVGSCYIGTILEVNENNVYALNELEARYDYNDISVDFLNTHFSNTNTIISPLTTQKAYYNYMKQNNITYDSLFSVFGNGLFNFDTSEYLLEEPLIKVFTAGLSKNQYTNADIKASVSDKLVLDEINAKLSTLSNEKIVYTVDDSNIFNYNIFGLCVLDSRLKVDNFIEEDNTYLISGKFETYTKDDITYVKIPLENENYSLILKRGLVIDYDKFIPLYTEYKTSTLRIPKINYESVEYPAKMYVNTTFGKNFNLDSNLTNLTMICHLNLTCVSNNDNTEEIGTDIIDFSKDCNFYIQNNITGNYVILGNFI